MSVYRFIANNQPGEEIKGWISAENEKKAERSLKEKGYENISMKPSKSILSPMASTSKALAVFCRQMSSVWASDISFPDGILLVAEQTEQKSLQIATYNIYDKIINDVHLSEAMRDEGVFPEYIVNMVAIGESSGTLDKVFTQLADYYEKDSSIKAKVRSAVTYPVILAILLIWVIGLLVVKILPMFESMLVSMGGQLPAVTAAVIAVSAFIIRYGLIILVAIAFIILFLLWLNSTKKGKMYFGRRKLSYPGFGVLYRRIITSKFAHGMAIMLESGVPVDNAVEKVAKLLENAYLEEKLEFVKKEIDEGKPLARAIAAIGVFPPLMIRMLVVGERTGRLGSMFGKSAAFFDEQVDEAMQRISTIIEPTMIVILSVIIGIILLAVMLPLINIMKVVG